MTPTDELRAKLDELGVEYTSAEDAGGTQHVWWSDGEKEVCAIDRGRMNDELAVYHLTPEQAIAATAGAGTCEPWDMRSNHAVQAANEQKVDERNTVPETKYLMALDEAREARKDAERWERIARDRKSMCESLKETNADLRKIIRRIKEDK